MFSRKKREYTDEEHRARSKALETFGAFMFAGGVMVGVWIGFWLPGFL